MATLDKLFLKGKKADYVALDPKNANSIYICTDSRELYAGSLLFSGGLRTYTGALPTVPAAEVLYFNAETGVGSYYDGTAWKTAIRATVTSITSAADDNTVPSAKAVKSYVDALIADITGGSGIVTNVEAKAGAKGTLVVTKGDGSTSDVALTGVAHDVVYDSTNLRLTIPMVGGTDLVVNLPKDNFVESGSYNSATKAIELTLKDKTVVSIPAAALIDIYTSGSAAADTVSIAVSDDNKITAAIKVDTTGALGIKADGTLTVDLSAYATATRVKAVEDAVGVINGNASTAGSIAKALADAKAYTDSKDTAMNTRMTAAEGSITTHGTRIGAAENALTWGTF